MRAEIGAVAVAGVVMGAALLGGVGDAIADPAVLTPPVAGRVNPPGKYALTFGNTQVGWADAVTGGQGTDVVSEKVGPDHIVHKHIGGVKYSDFTITCGAGMSKGFYDWIKASLENKYARKDGSVRSLTEDLKATQTIDFKGLVTEIGMPALDAGSKDAAKMTIKFAPEYTRFSSTPGGGATIGPLANQKTWVPATFKFDYPRCGTPCAEAFKLSAVIVKLGAEPPAGQTAAPLRASNIVVTMPPQGDLMKWAAEGSLRDGTLEYRAADGSVLIAMTLQKMHPVQVKVISLKGPQGDRPYVEVEFNVLSVAPK